MTSKSLFPWAKGNCLDTRGLSSPLKQAMTPIFQSNQGLCLPGSPQYISKTSPRPHIAWRIFYVLLSLHSQFKTSKTIKIPGPLQFAGFVPTFEFLLILLLTGHLLFCSSYIFFFILWCVHDFVPSWNFLFLRSGMCISFHFAFTMAYHHG